MTGYHVTAAGFLPSIMKLGLVPYSMEMHPQVAAVLENVGLSAGVWLWKRWEGDAHVAGCVLDRVGQKKTWRVAVLEAEYDETDAMISRWLSKYPKGQISGVWHNGSFGGMAYHRDEPFDIVVETIPPERLRVVASLDVSELLAAAFSGLALAEAR